MRNATSSSPEPSIEDQIAKEAAAHVTEAVLRRADRVPLDEAIGSTVYHERLRLAHASSASRDEADRAFYARVAHDLRPGAACDQARLVSELVDHYAREIEGHFEPRVYAFATRALPVLLTGLLNGIAPRRVFSRLGRLSNVDDRVLVRGEIDTLRALTQKGTVILVPTHSSNLDSLIIGYAIYRMGLPPFTYGAGLNLFSNAIEGYFMRHLGAYTVDRKKKDPLYREVLKEYATVSLERGQHSLFFPGGTRSRSGAIESHLKKGLLGASITAFRRNLLAGREKPRLYVFPCTLSYPLVLEAATLIAEHLADTGEARYIAVDDEYSRIDRWAAFMSGLMDLDVRIHVTVGRPLDPLGNDVDEQGDSRDGRMHPIDPARYLFEDGVIAEDAARDAEYTTALAARILEAYRRDNVVLPTALLSYAVFEALHARARHPELHRFLRELTPADALRVEDVLSTVQRLLGELDALATRGSIRLCDEIRDRDTTAIVDDALRTLSTYHARPVLVHDGDALHVGDPPLLFYYRNRLDGYGLLDAPARVPGSNGP